MGLALELAVHGVGLPQFSILAIGPLRTVHPSPYASVNAGMLRIRARRGIEVPMVGKNDLKPGSDHTRETSETPATL